VDNSGDTVIEQTNAGTDQVKSSISYTLGNNLENLVLTGTAFINGTGNTLNNSLTGNTADNLLDGGNGKDILTGGAGNDILVGGFGNDNLTGGTGADRFAFNTPSEGIDIITDFKGSQGDKIVISAAGFGGGLVAGASISSAQLVLGTTANQGFGQFLYEGGTGQLFFDPDGIGAGAAQQIANLSNKPILDTAGFVII
jgi:Ca2+-binding RTX toxin-like protein